MNNISCLYIKNKDYIKGLYFIEKSIIISNEMFKVLDDDRDNNKSAYARQHLVTASRYFNKGLCCFMNIQHLINVYLPFTCVSDHVKDIPKYN